MLNDPPKPKSTRRGFAGLSPEKRREIGSKGGKSVPPEKRGFARNPELARKAGAIGGKLIPRESRSFFANRELAREAGVKGGLASWEKDKTPRRAKKLPPIKNELDIT